MKVGMLLPSAGQQATRDNLVQAAKQAEEERFLQINPVMIYPFDYRKWITITTTTNIRE